MANPLLPLNDGRDDTSPELKGAVKELQALLNKDGFQLEGDGIFGRDTESAVKRFQMEHGLDDDGVVSPLTWSALLGMSPPADINSLFITTYPQDDPALSAQLNEALKYGDLIKEGAVACDLPQCVIAGMGSRESHWGLILNPKGPTGTGDFTKRRFPTSVRQGPLPPDGGGFSKGPLQIDYDAHEFAHSGNWRDPRANILYGCRVLSDNVNFFKRKTCLEGRDFLKAALSAYNVGAGNVLKTIQNDQDVDFYTAGRDYSSDVLNRTGWFQSKGWA